MGIGNRKVCGNTLRYGAAAEGTLSHVSHPDNSTKGSWEHMLAFFPLYSSLEFKRVLRQIHLISTKLKFLYASK